MLALLLLATLAEPGPVRLWHSYRGGEAKALAQALQGQDVRILEVPFGAYVKKLRHGIPQGQGPDLFIAGHDILGEFLRRELVQPYVAPPPAGLAPKSVAALTASDRVWGLPLALKTLGLYRNTDLVAAAPATLAAMVEAAKASGARFGLAYETGSFYHHAPWHLGEGAGLFDDKGHPVLARPEGAAALHRVSSWLRGPESIAPRDANGALVTELFCRAQAAMVVNGPWFASEVCADVTYAVSPLPALGPGRPARPFLTVEAVFLARGASAGAEAVARTLLEDDAALIRAVSGRQVVPNDSLYRGPLARDPFLRAFREQAEEAVPTPTDADMALLWEPMNEALRQVARGAKTPEMALAAAEVRISALKAPPPSPRSATPYLAVLGALVVGLLVRLWRRRPDRLGPGWAYRFVAPSAVGMVVLLGVPAAVGVALGFFSFTPEGVAFVGLDNFISILTGAAGGVGFFATLGVTVAWTLSNVALHVLLGVLLALALDQPWLPFRGPLRMLLILPWAIPSYITALTFNGLFNSQLGAINALLRALGLPAVDWFGHAVTAFCANLVANVWMGFPFMLVTVLSGLQAIPRDLYDAAKLDGAGRRQVFWWITLPQLRPVLMPAVVLGSIWTFNMFNVVYLVSQGQPDGRSNILVTEAYAWAFERNGRYGYAAAYSLLILALLYLYTQVTARLTEPR